ncbi:hypothetical protein CLV59_11292 [Chitinophaga dinghuensis]|uniref:GH25 family protein n=1 Tax=Chitinophaga dinghuensis TaxID=1539050 RepID=A0A327VLM0_9BACT|nr:hypothetical protein [Chitinophaga dinghuensis]RAJ73751.1 hypothetical protein CLV59_11292 [Chitinophaga dinghuensis]
MKWKHIFWILLLLVTPVLTFAHGYWLDISGNGKVGAAVTIHIFFGEIDSHGVRQREKFETPPAGNEFNIFVIDPKGVRTPLKVSAEPDGWKAVFLPTVNGSYRIFAESHKLPVVERSGPGKQNIRPIEYLYGAYTVGKPTLLSPSQQDMDILHNTHNDMTAVTVYQNGKVVPAGIKLRIFNPDNWEKQLETDSLGKAEFFPKRKGLYIIRFDWYDKMPGEYNKVGFTSIRYRCNLCLDVK